MMIMIYKPAKFSSDGMERCSLSIGDGLSGTHMTLEVI